MCKQHHLVNFSQSQRKKSFDLGNKSIQVKTCNLAVPQFPVKLHQGESYEIMDMKCQIILSVRNFLGTKMVSAHDGKKEEKEV